ncbi:MAG: hypothetical protein EOS26_29805 [Mesorhizobium sp.]|nr:MAG: hypothetical protein EOS26_29805 [Mesorhizobium sp.]
MKKVILAAVLTLTMGSAVALAYNQNDLNPNNDQSQAKAAANCVVEVMIDQLIAAKPVPPECERFQTIRYRCHKLR